MRLFDDGEWICDGRFVIERFLGRGTVGEGYLCRDSLLDSDVVCKVALSDAPAASDEFKLQFKRLSELRSPGVVGALGYHRHEKRSVVVLEWIGGVDLDKWVPTNPLKARLDALAQIASTLHSLQTVGVHHGDLWGGVNILVGSNRGCVLIDPQPNLWGSVSFSTERRTDIESLIELIERMAPEYAANRFAALTSSLKADQGLATLEAVVSQLKGAAASAPYVPGADETYLAAGAAYQERKKARNDLYRKHRLLRANALEELTAMVREAAAPFGLDVEVTEREDPLYASNQDGLGRFPLHAIICSDRPHGGGGFVIWFDEVSNLLEPWPYAPDRSLACGQWKVNSQRGQGQIELLLDEAGASGFFASHTPRMLSAPMQRLTLEKQTFVRVDSEWIRKRVADLTGTKSP